MRDSRVDFWRGLCIFGMISWHLLTHPAFPRPLSFVVIQSFNFVAEGFVFLAGVALGIREARQSAIQGTKHLGRALRLLLVHYATVLVLVALFFASPWFGRLPAGTAGDLLWAIGTLRYQPYLADILTVFVFLFAAAPVMLAVRRRFGNGTLLVASALIFGLSHVVQWAGGVKARLAIELNSRGAFDANTWQLVFVLGIILGAVCSDANGLQLPTRWRWRTWLLASSVFAGLFAIRLMVKLQGAGALPQLLAFERHPLTPARLAYVASQMLLIGMLTTQFWVHIEQRVPVRLLVAFGRHSLSLFVWSIFMDYLLKAVLSRYQLGAAAALILWAAEVAALAGLVVLYYERRVGASC